MVKSTDQIKIGSMVLSTFVWDLGGVSVQKCLRISIIIIVVCLLCCLTNSQLENLPFHWPINCSMATSYLLQAVVYFTETITSHFPHTQNVHSPVWQEQLIKHSWDYSASVSLNQLTVSTQQLHNVPLLKDSNLIPCTLDCISAC